MRVVDQLRTRGAKVHFVLEQRWGIDVQQHVSATGASWCGVPFVASLGMPKTLLELKWAARSFILSPADLARAAETFRPRQVLATSLNTAFFGRRLARRNDVISVFRLPNPPVLSQRTIKRGLDRACWRAVYSSFDRLVCNARYTADQLADVVGDDAKIQVVRNFPPLRRKTPVGDAPPRSPATRRVVYLGQIARHKGVDVLIEAMSSLMSDRHDLELLLAGADVWQDPFGEVIRSEVQARGLHERIRFLGPVTDVHELLSSSDIHVCPSVSAGESFPNVVIEAKQSGTPSVVFPTAGLPEAVTDGVDGLVTMDQSAASLSAAIALLLDDEPLRRRLAEGAANSLAEFDEDKISQQWVELLTTPKEAPAV